MKVPVSYAGWCTSPPSPRPSAPALIEPNRLWRLRWWWFEVQALQRDLDQEVGDGGLLLGESR